MRKLLSKLCGMRGRKQARDRVYRSETMAVKMQLVAREQQGRMKRKAQR